MVNQGGRVQNLFQNKEFFYQNNGQVCNYDVIIWNRINFCDVKTTALTPWFPHTSPCPETHPQFLKQFLQAGAQWDPQWDFQDWVETLGFRTHVFNCFHRSGNMTHICSMDGILAYMYHRFKAFMSVLVNTCITDFGLLEIEVMFFSIGGGFTCFVVASTTLSTLWYWGSKGARDDECSS